MKKFISLTIVAVLLIQMNLPVLSFAVDEEKALQENINIEEQQENKQEKMIEKQEKEENNKVDEMQTNMEVTKNKEEIAQENKEEIKKIQANGEKIKAETNAKVLSTPNQDTIIALDNHIKKALNESNYDKDGDGEFTVEELSKVYWLYIECDDEYVDLTGIENMTNLSTIGFNRTTIDTDFTVLSQLPLDTLSISGFFDDISFLQNLKGLSELSISFFDDNVSFDILSTLTTLQSLKISCEGEIDTYKLSNLTELKYLTIQGRDQNIQVNLSNLSKLTNLIYLGLENVYLGNLSGLETLTNVRSLELSFQYNDNSIDSNTLAKLSNIKELRLENYSGDISWVNNITNLQSLEIYSYRNGMEVTPEFIETINSLKVKDFALEGKIIYNAGTFATNEQAEIPFDSIPIIKEMQNPSSKFYYEDFEYSKKDDLITIDKENKKILLNIENDDTRSATIEFDNYITLEIQWNIAEDDEEPELSDKIKTALKKVGADKDNNGKYTISELKNVHSLDLNFSSNDEFNITGIEKMKNLGGLTINASCPEIDLSLLKELPNLTYLSLGGNFNSMDTLEGLTNLVSLRISTYNKEFNFNFEKLNSMTNIEALDLYGMYEKDLNNMNQLTNLNKLKRLTLNFSSEPDELKLDAISNLTNLEELNFWYIKTDNLKGLEKLTKLRKLYIQPVLNKYNNDVDTETIKKLTNLEQLKITLTDDPSWVNSLSKLNQVVLVANTTEDNYENPQKIQELINNINKIKAGVKLIGEFDFDLGSITVGEERDINISDNILVKELKNPSSKLYSPNININVGHYNTTNEWNYNEKTKIAHLKVTEFGNDYAHVSAMEYGQDEMSISIDFKWKGFIDDDKETEIPINDENLKKALLEKYDIDGNKKITKHDLLNIDELDLDNKGIEDITILSAMPNLESIILSNNKIKNIKVIEELSNSIKIHFINLKNNEIEDIQQIKDANFEVINLSENYIDFSENSANRKIIVDFGTERWGNEYDFYAQYMQLNQTREEFINENIDNYFKTNAANQKTKQTFKRGDVNGDGRVNAGDYVAVLNYVRKKIKFSDEQLQRADANGDSKVNAGDYVTILNIVRGKI